MGAVGLGNHTGQQADGAGTVDGAEFASLQTAAVYAVQGDGQRLCHGGQGPVHILGHLHQHIRRVAEVLRHAAVHMDAKDVQVGAAVGSADGAGIAVTAVEVGIYDDLITHLQALGVVIGNGLDNTSQLVTDNPGIGNQTVGAAECANVAAADTRGFDFNECFSGAGNRFFQIDAGNVPRLCQIDCFHKKHLPNFNF